MLERSHACTHRRACARTLRTPLSRVCNAFAHASLHLPPHPRPTPRRVSRSLSPAPAASLSLSLSLPLAADAAFSLQRHVAVAFAGACVLARSLSQPPPAPRCRRAEPRPCIRVHRGHQKVFAFHGHRRLRNAPKQKGRALSTSSRPSLPAQRKITEKQQPPCAVNSSRQAHDGLASARPARAVRSRTLNARC